MEELNLEQKRPEILRSVEFAKTKGVTAIKVELEAQLNRRNTRYSGEVCEECDEGHMTCYDCDEGWVSCGEHCDEGMVRNDADTEWVRCPELCDEGNVRCENECDEGLLICPECNGNWQGENAPPDWRDDATCLNYILNQVGIENSDQSSRIYRHTPERSDWLQFAKFLVDGSVDSEITFTVRLDNPENIFKVVDMVNAFKALSEAIGQGMNVDGAGMHISWLFTEDCSYYSERHGDYAPERVRYNYDSTSLRHFSRAMNHMMPALYFLAAPIGGKNWTRGFRYREPSVSLFGHHCAAIHINYGAIEYRVFDTCYDHPEQVFDHIVVMGNSLKYLTRTYTGPRSVLSEYRFGHDSSRTLDRLYYEENTLDLLYEHIGKLKPSYYTMAQMRQQRGFTVTKSSIKKKMADIKMNAELAWREYDDRWKIMFGIQSEEAKYAFMREYVERANLEQLRGMSDEQINQAIQAEVATYLKTLEKSKSKMADFIAAHESQQLREIKAQYRVSINA